MRHSSITSEKTWSTSPKSEVKESAGQIDSSVEDGSAEGLDEPKLGIILGNSLEFSDTVLSSSSLGDSVTASLEADSEVHTENTS